MRIENVPPDLPKQVLVDFYEHIAKYSRSYIDLNRAGSKSGPEILLKRISSHEFKIKHFKARVSSPRIVACLDLNTPLTILKLLSLDQFFRTHYQKHAVGLTCSRFREAEEAGKEGLGHDGVHPASLGGRRALRASTLLSQPTLAPRLSRLRP